MTATATDVARNVKDGENVGRSLLLDVGERQLNKHHTRLFHTRDKHWHISNKRNDIIRGGKYMQTHVYLTLLPLCHVFTSECYKGYHKRTWLRQLKLENLSKTNYS
jgi:hypothetical protein